jgi:hypothetical protein
MEKRCLDLFLNYDKIYFAFGFKTEQKNNDAHKGNTNYSNYVLQLGTNKLVIEGGYRKYKGFYDASTPQYIKPFTDSTLYYQNKNLENRNFKIKTFYFLNHKRFSYNSAYFGSFRQLKSAFSLLLGANFYTNKIVSDTSLIPPYARDIFGNYSMLKEIHVTGFSFGGGGSANLIIGKRFFLNLTATLEMEPQWRKYVSYPDGTTSPCYISPSSDFRASFGFNNKHIYILLSSVNDITFNKNKSLIVTGNFFMSSTTFIYRFHFESKITRWMKENRIYKMI